MIRVESFRGVWKSLCRGGVLDVRWLVYSGSIWIFNDVQVEIGELWAFLGVNRGVLVDPNKEVLEEEQCLLGTQEVIYGAFNY